jgi:hypothetical protein
MNRHAQIEAFEERIRNIAFLAKTDRVAYDTWLDSLEGLGWLEPRCAQDARNHLLLSRLARELGLVGSG